MAKKKESVGVGCVVYARVTPENDAWLTKEMLDKNEFMVNIINEMVVAAREGRVYKMKVRVDKTLERLLKQKENRRNACRE